MSIFLPQKNNLTWNHQLDVLCIPGANNIIIDVCIQTTDMHLSCQKIK